MNNIADNNSTILPFAGNYVKYHSMISKRSIILNGVTTSISMESALWEQVDCRAQERNLAWQDYVRQLLEGSRPTNNRSSAIRETLIRELIEENLQASEQYLESWWQLISPSGRRDVGTRGSQLIVGRSAGNSIVVEDPDVSRRHFMLVFDGIDWRAVDLDSRNGIWLNKKRHNAVRMTIGTVLDFGSSKIRLLK